MDKINTPMPIMKSGKLEDTRNTMEPLEDNFQCTIYPNPASDYLQVVMKQVVENRIHWKLTNSMGTEVIQGEIAGNQVGTSFKIEFGGPLSKGIYFISIQDGPKRITKKILVH